MVSYITGIEESVEIDQFAESLNYTYRQRILNCDSLGRTMVAESFQLSLITIIMLAIVQDITRYVIYGIEGSRLHAKQAFLTHAAPIPLISGSRPFVGQQKEKL